MYETVDLVVQIVIAALFAWFGVRAWRSQNRLLKWGGSSSAFFLAVVASVMIALTSAGLLKLSARTAATPNLKVAGTASQAAAAKEAEGYGATGRRMFASYSCCAVNRPSQENVARKAWIASIQFRRIFRAAWPLIATADDLARDGIITRVAR